MFYRRKILLSLFQLFDGEIEKIRLQKLLFLYSKRKPDPEYDFIPYKYGCYSYSANADLITMVKKGILIENEISYSKNDNVNYIKELKIKDKDILEEIFQLYGKMGSNALIIHTYINFPFYAIKSTIAKRTVPEEYYKKIIDATPKQKEKTLFTIGYEGVSLEKYLKKLLENNVKLLVDVRKNPLSMKYGFSKTLLKRYCNSVDIDYLHTPDVGIESNKRQDLKTQKDYDFLFDDYKVTTLKNTIESQKEILKLLNQYNRIALTCFESNVHQCHRLHLAKSLNNLNHRQSAIKHI